MHFAAGLGDGNVQTHQEQQGLRGNSNTHRTKKRAYAGDDFELPMDDDADTIQSNGRKIRDWDYRKHNREYNNVGDDEELLEYLRNVANRREALAKKDDPIVHTEKGTKDTPRHAASDGLWQLSVIVLLGIIGVLVGLFIHFSTDPSGQPFFRNRIKKKMLSRPGSYKKKTDDYSDDEEAADDSSYRGDNEGAGGKSSKGVTVPKKRPVAPNDPTARLYYPINTGDGFRQQESRLRKSSQQQTNINNVDGGSSLGGKGGSTGRTSFHSPSRPRRQSASVASGNINNKEKKSPAVKRSYIAPTITPSSSSSRNGTYNTTSQSLFAPPLPFGSDSTSELGWGLEGFEHTTSSVIVSDDYSSVLYSQEYTRASPVETPQYYSPVITGLPLVKQLGPFTPSESFGSIPISTGDRSSASSNHPPKSANDIDRFKQENAPDSFQRERSRLRNSLSPIPDSVNKSYESPERSGFSSIGENSLAPESNLSQQSVRTLRRSSTRRSHTLNADELSELPTPRVDHTRGKFELKKMLLANGKAPGELKLPTITGNTGMQAPLERKNSTNATSADPSKPIASNSDAANKYASLFPNLPLVPSLNKANPESTEVTHSDSYQEEAPHSVLLEELQLVRMESGVTGPRWRSTYEMNSSNDNQPHNIQHPDHHLPSENEDWFRSGGQSFHHPMFGPEHNSWYEEPNTETMEKKRQENENMEKLREASSHIDPADDPRNSIQHVRTDLTVSSDASSSLSSTITFSELKLQDIIGGGGFGQVWRATWKGTPVAVKVLTGSAQAERIPKSVLEEFISEINLVSGMRHPNICLFMGACLDPPNRAIITELCENGSLWDALRSPLGSPYRVADGKSRRAWPQYLYDSMAAPPILFGNDDSSQVAYSPIAPKGAWPWILVKRVAAGAARGMTYLHSGNPPVLHRDLKSANILLDESYTAKLADFGLSRLKAVRSAGMTGNCGTVQWMAPEVLCSEEYAEPADVFSYGIILWEMLTRECPYEGMSPIQCALSVLNENRRPEIPEWCPQPFRALIKDCVEKDPKLRPSFPQILVALDAMP